MHKGTRRSSSSNRRLGCHVILFLSVRSITTAAFLSTFRSPSKHHYTSVAQQSGDISTLAEGRIFNAKLVSRGGPNTVLCSSNAAELSALTVPELKDLLRKKGSRVSGKKSELIERLCSLKEGEQDQWPWSVDVGIASDDIGFEVRDDGVDYEDEITVESSPEHDYPFSISDISSRTLQSLLQKRNITSLLPVQSASFNLIFNGGDAVMHAPTGSGKTLAFVVPLLARLARDNEERNQKASAAPTGGATAAVAPRIVVVVPSRELAKQVGRVWQTLHPRKTRGVATVFGGAPLERNVAALGGGRRRSGSGGVDVVIGTAGRLRELIREGHLTFDEVQSLVLDEADSLLDFKDNPDVERLLNYMEHEFQLVLASATINESVREFAMDVMEIDESSESFITVASGVVQIGKDFRSLSVAPDTERKHVSSSDFGATTSTSLTNERRVHGAPPVRHWSIATRANVRRAVVSDLITTLQPRMTIIFIPTKAEVETIGAELLEKSGGALDVRVLHGDMVQSARSRTLALLRGNGKEKVARQKVLVATDVASRGLDLDGVDLVIQFGIPRQNGKENTYDAELYIHRTGRAGRFGEERGRAADAILLYDPTQGEGKILPSLTEELKGKMGFDVWERPLLSPNEVMDATYERVSQRCNGGDEDLVRFFREKLLSEMNISDREVQIEARASMLLDKLSRAMAALSGLEEVTPKRSLLTADQSQLTLRAFKTSDANNSILSATPPEITRLCKGLGTGKIGRVSIWDDGSAVFDLPAKKAQRLIENLADSPDRFVSDGEWHIELPSILPPRSLQHS